MALSRAEGEFVDTVLRGQLLDRHHKLEAAIARHAPSEHLVDLLQEVDAALERMDDGTFGLCKACHEPIEAERLISNPLLELCLAHLTEAQQHSLERDLEMARRIQQALLPRNSLVFHGWESCYHYQPAGLVSGDYCDLVEGADGKLHFLFGDVSGKGVAASILTGHLHAMFRALITASLPLDELLARANALFCESTMPACYATLVCGRADATGEIEIANAGHCPPLRVGASQAVAIAATGLPLGLFGNSVYGVEKVLLDAGESLLLYTDGVSEARDRSNAEYGSERLSTLAVAQRHLCAEALVRACLDDLRAFQKGASQADDLTLMVLRRAAGRA
jgi:phosphoserine phosphatase RsbU/P